MHTPRKIGVIVGSLRKESFNRKMAKALSSLAPAGLELEILEIGNLSLYNQDLDDEDDATPPAEWVKFRDQVRAKDGVLFVTPEYNRSIPGVLKNAIDIASRPYGESAWEGKPGAVISVSPGSVGGFGANHHLRQCLVFLDVPCMQQPEAYIGKAGELFDEKGGFKKDSTRELMRTFLKAYSEWVELISSRQSRMEPAA